MKQKVFSETSEIPTLYMAYYQSTDKIMRYRIVLVPDKCYTKAMKMRIKEGNMSIESKYISDMETILSHRYDNGADYWTTADHKLLKGAPYTTLESILYLLELGIPTDDEVMRYLHHLNRKEINCCLQSSVSLLSGYILTLTAGG